MRFLVDAQLPPALARFLASNGHQAEHVADVGLMAATDRAIWQFADSHGAIIVTKDEDFVSLVTLTSSGPAVVWIRLGNCSRSALLAWFQQMLPMLCETLARGERLVELS